MKRIPWKLLLWLVGLGPLLGLAGLVMLARLGDLPETEALANPKLVLQALDTHYGPYEPLEIMGSFVSAPPY